MLLTGTALPPSDGLLIAQVRELMAVLHRSRPQLALLRDQLDETVALCVLDGPQVVYLEEAERAADPHPASRRGQRRPLAETAAGPAVVAGLGAAWAGRPRPPGDGRACDLQRVRQRGYALQLEHGGRAQDVLAVAVALPPTCLSAALEVRSPLERLPVRRVPAIAARLHHAGRRLASALCLS